MNNRIPIVILVVLVFVALVWRVANPPAPPLPGPLGVPTTWDSRTKVGNMVASETSPSGKMWVGAWNQKTAEGKLRSALVVVNLEKSTAHHQDLGEGVFTSGLGWADDNTIRALLVDSEEPVRARVSRIAYLRDVGSKSPEFETGEPLTVTVSRVLDWMPGSNLFCAQLAAGPEAGTRFAVLDGSGKIVGKPAIIALPGDTMSYRAAGLAPDGGSFVFSVAEDKAGGDVTYYLVDAKNGTAKEAFTSKEAPGRVEGMWVSPAGVLIVLAQRDTFRMLRYDPISGKVADLPKGTGDVKKLWPGAPESMEFVTYNGGYDLDLATGKTKQLFDFTRQGRFSDAWRRHVQDGRLYPRGNGDYTAISVIADEVDIRVIENDGDKGADILPRG